MISTTAAKPKNKTRRIKLRAALFWLILWQLGSMALGQPLLLVSPATVVMRIWALAATTAFWKIITYSLLRIAGGFFLAAAFGVVLAALAARSACVRALLLPVVSAIKAIPVASFIVLALIWVSSKNLSVLISFLMVFPVVYTNVLSGICSTDRHLLEMAQVFALSAVPRLRYIYLSQVLPYFRAACSVGLGLCWKSGIAAEVIGIPKGSMGEQLYNAKIYLDTPDLFCWTLVIVLVSLFFERVFLALLDVSVTRLERM